MTRPRCVDGFNGVRNGDRIRASGDMLFFHTYSKIHFELPRLAAGNSKCSWVEGHGTRTIARFGEVTHAPVSGRRGTHSAREAGDRRCSSSAWWPHTPLCRGGGGPTVPGRQGTDDVRRALDGFSFEHCSDSYQVHSMNINERHWK